MSYERSKLLLHFTLIGTIFQLAFGSQATFAVNRTIPVSVNLGLTSRDDDALYVQVVFDQVLQKVSDKVNMSFGYVKECVHLLRETPSMSLMRTHNIASGLMMNSMGCGVLPTGLTVRGTCNSYVCTNMLHSKSGGTLSCVKTKRERMESVTSR